MNSIIEVKNLTKEYGFLKVLKGIDFEIKKGEIKCIIGPSGCGKTTFLRCLSLLENADEGKIIFDEKDVVLTDTDERKRSKARKKVGIVFQDFNLWPHKTVMENIVEPLTLIKGFSRQEAKKKALHFLKKVGMDDCAGVYPDFLSGGQKQRVAIARTLAMEPEIILFDEITSALDPELIGGILKLIKRLAYEGQTMILVTHHIDFASEIADEILFMADGRIVEKGSPDDILRHPEKKRTKEFLNSLKMHSQEINVYEGVENFRAFNIGFMKRIKPGKEYLVLGAAKEDWWECMGEAQYEWNKLRAKKNIKVKMILYEFVKSEEKMLKDMPDLTEYRVISKKTEVPSNVNIYDDTILMLVFGENPTVIEVKNEKLVRSYLNYFNILWEEGKEVKI
jgi:ABC-type polar amino acid transport system ATPase subunit